MRDAMTEHPHCQACGERSEFGYKIKGEMQWFCVKHRLSQRYADARLPKPEPAHQIARPLHVLVPLIKEELNQAQLAAQRAAMPYYLAAGKMILEAKAQLEHGQFGKWVNQNLRVTQRQAREYIALAEHEAAQTGSALPFSSLADFKRSTGRYTKPHTAAAQPSVAAANAKEAEALLKLEQEIIATGYRALAAKMHPDKGGSAEAMARLNKARDRLRNKSFLSWAGGIR
jgi:hypothetical protein